MVTRPLERGAPAPPQLATPTDLERRGVEEIAKAVNPLIADAFSLYVKTKNFHWHLASSHFRDYHLLFDEQAEALLKSVDPLAERLRRIGATTIRGLDQIRELREIGDDTEDFVPAEEMVRRLLEDNRGMAERQRRALEVCDQHNDRATANVLEEILNGTEKRVWFLFEVLHGEPARPKPHRA